MTGQNRVQQIRLAKGLTVLQLSLVTGVTRQTIYSIEGSKPYRPSAEVLGKLAKALDVTIDDLLNREDAA